MINIINMINIISKINMRVLFTIFIVLLLIDSVFLYTLKSMFNKQIIEIQGSPIAINIHAAIICYVFLVFGLYYFIVREKKGIFESFLLGLIIYGVYETTTLTLLKKWHYKTAIIDTLWGGVLFALTTKIVYYLQK